MYKICIMVFGKSFKFYRQRASLTQKEAADLIGVKDYQLGNYETNRSEPSLAILKKMSKVYSVSIDKLLGNSMVQKKHEKKDPEAEKQYVDIQEVLKNLTEYVEQENSLNKK